jgi:hypothetical protein
MAFWEKFSNPQLQMSSKTHTPVHRQLIETVRVGFQLLDRPVQNEITAFIAGRQASNGAFMDRAGRPDFYYSLFACWISMAAEQTELQDALKGFITSHTLAESKSPVEELALLLIRRELDDGFRKKSVLSIIKPFLKKGRMIELSYQFFLISLAIDAAGKNKGFYFLFARIWLGLYRPGGNMPCSLVAALLYARKILGLNTYKRQKRLLDFALEGGGFRAFDSVQTADMLSTGVALFVLKGTGYDLRIIKPGCLEFVQKNYLQGAFISGDGDLTKDLEYTFYGLLALGSLAKD